MTKVLLTGASGFIAKHILRELLERGCEVRASVRSDARKGEIEALFPEAKIEFATLDLLKDEGWEAAATGCDVLIHTASPFPLAEPRTPDELIRPAVDGTKRAMAAAKAAGIERVILTSSCAAIFKDAAKPKGAPSTEANWTTADAPFVSSYEASKTLAERAAWDFVAANPEIALTTINPGAVFGPPMDARYGASLELVERLMGGKDPFAPPINLPVADVRDVARMHVAAIELEAAKGERFAAAADSLRAIELIEMLRDWDPTLKMTRSEAPHLLVRFFALLQSEARMIAANLGRNLAVSGAKAEAAFGFEFIPAREALLASAEAVRAHKA